MSSETAFAEMHVAEPELAQVEAEMSALRERWSAAGDAEARREVLSDWDALRRRLVSWSSLTNLRFQQDTRDEAAKAARDRMDELRPQLQDLEVAFKRELLRSEHRAELERSFGGQAFALWDADVRSFAPELKQDLVRESKLGAEYTALLASAKLEFQGETCNLSGLLKHAESPARETRHACQATYWGFFAEHGAELDRIFAELVELRAGMAATLGLPSFTELGYLRMSRVDYDADDVARFRAEVRDELVPLCEDLRRAQAERLGVDALRYWDEAVHDPAGNPAPQPDDEGMLDAAEAMFADMGGLGPFFARMRRQGLLDLQNREGKAGGGFCTSFPVYGVPFVFANFNRTKGDVRVFSHEAGHAYQNYSSQSQPLLDYLWPTSEAAEVHSMSLEFLTWPHMERFFGDDAERFRRVHLIESLLFLPYGVAIDHFQHEVYARPEASPAERHGMWSELERTYLPWRDYGDLARPAAGALWQRQRHVYQWPFYYIDYTLALTCAMQFWVQSLDDFDDALRRYDALCARGGSAPFQELVRAAGLRSPFERGCLQEVAAKARDYLGL